MPVDDPHAEERDSFPSARGLRVSDGSADDGQPLGSSYPPGGDPVKQDRRHGIVEFVVMLLVAFGLVLAVQRFIVQPFKIPSGSMIPTIPIGDYILSEKISYHSHGPEVGDIITFKDPMDEDTVLIKRCIATEGQTVELIGGSVYVDGVVLDEPYTEGKPSLPLSPTYGNMSIVYPFTVPEGHVWVMGDNRTNSADSRYFGAVPVSSVSGRAFFVYWPPSEFGTL